MIYIIFLIFLIIQIIDTFILFKLKKGSTFITVEEKKYYIPKKRKSIPVPDDDDLD